MTTSWKEEPEGIQSHSLTSTMPLNRESIYHSHGGAMPILHEGLRLLADTTTAADGNHTDNSDCHYDDHVFEDGHGGFGVHISYEDLYNSIILLTCIYVSGQIASRLLKKCLILLERLFAESCLGQTWVRCGVFGCLCDFPVNVSLILPSFCSIHSRLCSDSYHVGLAR